MAPWFRFSSDSEDSLSEEREEEREVLSIFRVEMEEEKKRKGGRKKRARIEASASFV